MGKPRKLAPAEIADRRFRAEMMQLCATHMKLHAEAKLKEAKTYADAADRLFARSCELLAPKSGQ